MYNFFSSNFWQLFLCQELGEPVPEHKIRTLYLKFEKKVTSEPCPRQELVPSTWNIGICLESAAIRSNQFKWNNFQDMLVRLPLPPLAFSHINAYNIRSFPTQSVPSLDKNFKIVLCKIWKLNRGKYLVLQVGQTEVIVATSCAFKSKINLRVRVVLSFEFSY